MKIALDTNRYADSFRGDQDAITVIRRSERVYVPFVVLAELRAGFSMGTRAKRNEQVLRRFLDSPRVRVLLPDEHTTHHYATLMAQLRSQGTPIPTHDVWIAALVLQHDLTLFARDAHFDHIPQLPRV